MRGGITPSDHNFEQDQDYQNFLIWFGCPPNSGVDAKSTIAVDFFAHIKLAAGKNAYGRVKFPDDMKRFGEKVDNTNQDLELTITNWRKNSDLNA